MFSHNGARSAPVSSTRLALPWPPSAALKRLRLFAANAVWWVLSIGIVVAVWEGAAALQLIDPLILPPPHLFIAEIQQQAQFLLPRIGVQRVGANFVALTAINASRQRVLIGLLLAFIASLLIGSFAFYIDVFGKLMLPAVTLLAPIAPVAWIPFALVAFGIGDGAAIFVVFIGIVFTLTLGTVHHMTHVDDEYELDVSWHGDDRACRLPPRCQLRPDSETPPLVEEQRPTIGSAESHDDAGSPPLGRG
jgi:ABC-type nitrate/sulfonate/bicarbonate transport system permease component